MLCIPPPFPFEKAPRLLTLISPRLTHSWRSTPLPNSNCLGTARARLAQDGGEAAGPARKANEGDVRLLRFSKVFDLIKRKVSSILRHSILDGCYFFFLPNLFCGHSSFSALLRRTALLCYLGGGYAFQFTANRRHQMSHAAGPPPTDQAAEVESGPFLFFPVSSLMSTQKEMKGLFHCDVTDSFPLFSFHLLFPRFSCVFFYHSRCR